MIFVSLESYSQLNPPVEFRVEKQSMSTPMSPIEDIFFLSSYYTKPVTIAFDGYLLDMHYDNGQSFLKTEVTEVNRDLEYDDNNLILETIYYTNNNNVTDTILFVKDYEIGYIRLILPTENSKGEKIGYTSYKKYVDIHKVAMN